MSAIRNPTRREVLLAAGTAGLSAFPIAPAAAGEEKSTQQPGRTYRIGVVSASIHGKPQPRNGHTWHFSQYLHPEFDFDALKRVYPQMFDYYRNVLRNPRYHFDQLPFPDTKITHYYDADLS